MTTLIHLSDLHIGQSEPGEKTAKLGRERRLENVAKLVQEIVAHETPCPVVISGDITEHGGEYEYADALDALRPLVDARFMLLPMPGNHDCGPLGNFFQQSARQRFADFMIGLCALDIPAGAWPYVHEHDGVRIICVDSCVPPVPLATGSVGYLQTISIARELEAAQRVGCRTVVAMHHHPFYTGVGLSLRDSDTVLATLAHRTDLLLFGHKHVAGEWSEVHGIRRIYAACKSTETMRYRRITMGERIEAEWASVA